MPDNPAKKVEEKFEKKESPLSAGFDHKDTKDVNLTLHELTMRVEAIEKKLGL